MASDRETHVSFVFLDNFPRTRFSVGHSSTVTLLNQNHGEKNHVPNPWCQLTEYDQKWPTIEKQMFLYCSGEVFLCTQFSVGHSSTVILLSHNHEKHVPNPCRLKTRLAITTQHEGNHTLQRNYSRAVWKFQVEIIPSLLQWK